MLIVGLTGGIGSGKTAVSDIFAHHGVPIVDTDVLARELVAPGQPALKEIVEEFGPVCMNTDGELDRNYLRKTVFANPLLRKRLEAILHPRIRQAIRQQLVVIKAPYCIVVIPLLVETGMTELVHHVLVVDVPEAVQINRVIGRDHTDEAQVKRILASQSDRRQRLAMADEIIDNSGTLSDLETRVNTLHQEYLRLATVQTRWKSLP